MSNELTLGYTHISDDRGPSGQALPEIDITLPGLKFTPVRILTHLQTV